MANTGELIRREDHGAVARLVMTSGANFNALSNEMLAALAGELERIAADDTVRAVILAAEGKATPDREDIRAKEIAAGTLKMAKEPRSLCIVTGTGHSGTCTLADAVISRLPRTTSAAVRARSRVRPCRSVGSPGRAGIVMIVSEGQGEVQGQAALTFTPTPGLVQSRPEFKRGETVMSGTDGGGFAVGQRASIAKTITEADVLLFAAVSLDTNPVHLDAEAAKASPFGERVAHGMLSAGLISAVLGTKLPGPGAVYLGQTLKFRAPVRIGDTVTATAEAEGSDYGD